MGIFPFPEPGTPSLSKPETEPGQENTLPCPHQTILWWLSSCLYLGWEIWRGIYYYVEEHSKFSSVSQSCPTLCNPLDCSTPGFPVHHQHLELKLISIESVSPSNHLILCHPLFLLPSIFPSIRIFSNESALCIRWPKYWSFSFNISPSNENPGLISFRMDWLDLLAVQGTLKSLLQHCSSKASILLHSAFFIVQFSHPYWKNHSLD